MNEDILGILDLEDEPIISILMVTKPTKEEDKFKDTIKEKVHFSFFFASFSRRHRFYSFLFLVFLLLEVVVL
nr:MAG TPA: hypothetical protein [Caudoviricetes sp.]